MEVDRFAHLRADPTAWDLRCQGYSLELIDAVIERAAICEFDAGMGELAALVAAAAEVDRIPEHRRMHRLPPTQAAA